MAEVRLQKFLAECGVGSRRKMEELILKGKVTVNGNTVREMGVKVDPQRDRVAVRGRAVQMQAKGIMLLNKPRGVVSTLADPEGRPTIADFLTKHYQSYFPVGRLDWDSTGLLVLTNDGDLAEHLMHPRFGVERIYHARVEGSFPKDLLAKMRSGVKLRDGIVKADADILEGDDKSTWLEVRLHEGRNRVVRRLFERLGFPVIKLQRTQYGPFRLGKLQVGQMRVLTEKEYDLARAKVFRAKPGEATASRQERPQVDRRERSEPREGQRRRFIKDKRKRPAAPKKGSRRSSTTPRRRS